MRLLPRRLSTQFIGLLLIALLLGQLANLIIVVGERRILKRSSITTPAVEEVVRIAEQLYDLDNISLPTNLRHSPDGPRGAYFLSENNRAQAFPEQKRQADVEAHLSRELERAGIFTFSISASMAPFDSKKKPQFSELHPVLKPGREVSLFDPLTDGQRTHPPRPFADPTRFRPRIGPDSGGPAGSGMRELYIAVELEPALYLNAMIPYYPFSTMTHRILIATAILIGLTLLVSVWFAFKLSGPLYALTRASETLGRGEALEAPLPVKGPIEVKQATKAFNEMNERLTRLLATQQNLLRAVGHDLRTPITSLRIRAESIDDDDLRGRFVSTLDDMTLMTEDILKWAKDASGVEEKASTDLEALLESQIEDYRDQGQAVTLGSIGPLVLQVRRVAIKRAVQNLIDNALKFAGSAEINLKQDTGEAIIEVCDRGPGIPDTQIADATAPFFRGEPSRARETGGIGMGLAIAQSIAQNHGGRLELSDREGGGLCAAICLPLDLPTPA